jgi:hypothetical protein
MERVMDLHYERTNRFWKDFGKCINENEKKEFDGFVVKVEKAFQDHLESLIDLCPSDDFLCDLFLKDFEKKRNIYEQDTASLTANALMADHTFKVHEQSRLLFVGSYLQFLRPIKTTEKII